MFYHPVESLSRKVEAVLAAEDKLFTNANGSFFLNREFKE